MTWRPLLLRATSLLAGTLLSLLLGEAVTRALAPRVLSLSNPLARFDPQLGWLQQDGAPVHRVNEAGAEVVIEGDPVGIRRPPAGLPADCASAVLALGDSFTVGNQVAYADTWPAQLQAQLAPRHPDLCVINAGVDGYDLAQEFRLAERLLPRFPVRLVVVALFVGNDLVDYGSAAQARPPWQPSGPLVWIREHSYLFHFASGGLRAREQQTAHRRAEVPPAVAAFDPRMLPGLGALAPGEQDRIRGQFAAPELLPILRGGAEAQRRLAGSERMLEALAQLARSHCAAFAVLLIPAKPQALPEQRRAWQRMHGLSPEAVEAPQRALASWAQAAGVRLVDALPALAQAPQPERLFWRIDQHFSPGGHQLVATLLAPVVEQGLGGPACAAVP